MTAKEFKRVFKEAIKVIDEKVYFFHTPEEFFSQILTISNKSMSLPEIEEKFRTKVQPKVLERSDSNTKRDPFMPSSRRSSIRAGKDGASERLGNDASNKLEETLMLPTIG